MKLISKTTAAAISASALLLLQACGGSTTTQTTGTTTDTPAQTTQEEQTTFYLLPSPEDIFAFSADKLKYSAALLNPTSKAETYVDTKMRELNFGVYVADMAYAAAFGEYTDATKYLKTIKETSTQIGLESIFTNALTSRIDKVISNKDSLKAIANDTYYDIKKELEKNNRNSTIAQISAGGWVECMYIITNSIEQFSENDPNIQHVADEGRFLRRVRDEAVQRHQKAAIIGFIAGAGYGDDAAAHGDQCVLMNSRPQAQQST